MAVGGSMVPCKCGGYEGAGNHLTVDAPRTLDDSSKPHERHLGWVDDAIDGFRSPFSQIGEGDGRIGEFGRLQPTASHPRRQIAKLVHQFREALFVNIMQRRRNEAPAALRDGDAQVNGRLDDKPIFLPKSIEVGNFS